MVVFSLFEFLIVLVLVWAVGALSGGVNRLRRRVETLESATPPVPPAGTPVWEATFKRKAGVVTVIAETETDAIVELSRMGVDISQIKTLDLTRR